MTKKRRKKVTDKRATEPGKILSAGNEIHSYGGNIPLLNDWKKNQINKYINKTSLKEKKKKRCERGQGMVKQGQAESGGGGDDEDEKSMRCVRYTQQAAVYTAQPPVNGTAPFSTRCMILL